MEEKIGPALRARLGTVQTGELLDVDIFLNLKPAGILATGAMAADFVKASHERSARVETIKAVAEDSQRDLLSYLNGLNDGVFLASDNSSSRKAKVKEAYWISNSVAAEVSPEVLQTILERDDVSYVELRSQTRLQDLLDGALENEQYSESDNSRSPDPSPRLSENVSQTETQSNAAAPAQSGKTVPANELEIINVPKMWDQGLRGEGVFVAVIDSGVNYHHPDLQAHMWDGGGAFPKHGFDFSGSTSVDPMDTFGHGTKCAGIVAGDGTAGTITGVAPKATIIALKVDEIPYSVWSAMQFAIDHGADVISLSFSDKITGPTDRYYWRGSCQRIFLASVLHANSVGDNGAATADPDFAVPRNIGPPGSCPPPRLHPLQVIKGGTSSAISCGATTPSNALLRASGNGPVAWQDAPFSDYPFDGNGNEGLMKPDLCAPGLDTTSCNWKFTAGSTEPPYISDFSGTSPSAAYLAGCLALLVQACKRRGKPVVAAWIQEALEESARPIAGQSKKKENNFGAGRVDVYEAFKYGRDRGWWN